MARVFHPHSAMIIPSSTPAERKSRAAVLLAPAPKRRQRTQIAVDRRTRLALVATSLPELGDEPLGHVRQGRVSSAGQHTKQPLPRLTVPVRRPGTERTPRPRRQRRGAFEPLQPRIDERTEHRARHLGDPLLERRGVPLIVLVDICEAEFSLSEKPQDVEPSDIPQRLERPLHRAATLAPSVRRHSRACSPPPLRTHAPPEPTTPPAF